MGHRPQFRRDYQIVSQSSPYVLIVRGADRRPRFERFADANSYKARLAALKPSPACSLSLDEVVGWLEAQTADEFEAADHPTVKR